MSRHLLIMPTIVGVALATAVLAQTSGSAATDQNSVSETTTQTNYSNPTRTIKRHTESGNRLVDEQSVQVRGPDGDFQPYNDVEKETLQVDATTVRTTTRTFARDANGVKRLVQVTEEEKHNLPGGASDSTRAVSNIDVNGNLQVVQREIQETRKIGNGVDETKTTLMLPDINGGLSVARKVQERQQRTDKDTIETLKTTLLPDGAGNWQVDEVRKTTTKQDSNARNTVERVSRPDAQGRLEEVSRTISKESPSVPGEKRRTTETYSLDVPGSTRDGGLHLVGRETTTQRADSQGGQTTQRTLEQPSPGDPSSGMRVITVSTDVQRSGSTGAQDTQTVQMRDANGTLNVVSVDTTKSDNTRTIQVQIAPPQKH